MIKRKPKDLERSPDLPHNWVGRHISELEKWIYYDSILINNWEYKKARLTSINTYKYLDSKWKPISIGDTWGGDDTTVFFKKKFIVPKSHVNSDLILNISLDGGETQLSINGQRWQGLDCYRSIVPINELVKKSNVLNLEMEAFVINYPYDERRHDMRALRVFKQSQLCKRDALIEDCYFDFKFVLDAYMGYFHSNENLEIESFLMYHLQEACRVLGPYLWDTNLKDINCRKKLQKAATKARKLLREKIFLSEAFQPPGTIDICGHSHLDILYLWPIKETFRKNVRTTTNMLSLMREYPNFKFTSSQPFLFEKLKDMYPETFKELQHKVKTKKWEVTGGLYLEPDGNLLGGESIVRQLLFGMRFFEKEFNVRPQSCWLPDVFGVMYTFPQLLKKSGIKYFTSIKLNIWNDTNDFPHNIFRWRGLDGSEVTAFFPPTHFAEPCTPDALRRHWKDFKEKNTVGNTLFLYGWADGGGGPTREMVENNKRAKNFPGLPKTKNTFTEDYLKKLDDKKQVLPIWDDELYLEAHRGTYTTKAELKQKNRYLETLYRNLEIISSIAYLHGFRKMQQDINKGWKLIMLNQFHDTLPGTHVPECMPDIRKDYENAEKIGIDLLNETLTYLLERMNINKENDLVLFNTLSWRRNSLVQFKVHKKVQSIIFNNTCLPIQYYDDYAYCYISNLPSMGWKTISYSNKKCTCVNKNTADITFNHSNNQALINTPFYNIDIHTDGSIKSIFDKENTCEVLEKNGNVFEVFEDNPGYTFSAWDIAHHFEEYSYEVKQVKKWKIKSNGPLFAILEAQWQVLSSTITQEMWLYKNDRKIDFKTKVIWKDKQKLLKVAFPLAIRSKTATYDLPFGHIERATHRNTSWDEAKFEVCAHKWADLSEGNYGVALINNCKYGYDVKENVMRLSLLRSPIRPDSTSDIGEHEFVYTLFPHAKNWREAGVDRVAYESNMPVIAELSKRKKNYSNKEIPQQYSLCEVNSNNFIIEAIKQAEDGNNIIVRCFDSHGCHQNVKITFSHSVKEIYETNLLEENIKKVNVGVGNKINHKSLPYEINTYSCKLQV